MYDLLITMFISIVSGILEIIVDYTIISEVYGIQEILCILILIILFILALFDLKLIVKTIVTVLSIVTLGLHYYVLILVSQHVEVILLPFILIESTRYGSVFSIDFGQLILILIIILWRREIWGLIKKNVLKRNKSVESTGSTYEDRR